MTRFSVTHLPLDRIDETLPIARMAAPLLTAERWRRFARILENCSGGTLAALDRDGRTHGLAAYWVDESLIHGRVLRVEPMVTFEISASAPVRAALCGALELIAQTKSCDSLVISTGSRGYAAADGGKLGGWTRLGLDLAAVSLVKHLPPRATAASEAVQFQAQRRARPFPAGLAAPRPDPVQASRSRGRPALPPQIT